MAGKNGSFLFLAAPAQDDESYVVARDRGVVGVARGARRHLPQHVVHREALAHGADAQLLPRGGHGECGGRAIEQQHGRAVAGERPCEDLLSDLGGGGVWEGRTLRYLGSAKSGGVPSAFLNTHGFFFLGAIL